MEGGMEAGADTKQATRVLRLSRASVYNLLWLGRLQGFKDPETGAWVISIESIERYRRLRELKDEMKQLIAK